MVVVSYSSFLAMKEPERKNVKEFILFFKKHNCPACLRIQDHVESINKYFVEVDVQQYRKVASDLNITVVPSFAIVFHGRLSSILEGVTGTELRKALDS